MLNILATIMYKLRCIYITSINCLNYITGNLYRYDSNANRLIHASAKFQIFVLILHELISIYFSHGIKIIIALLLISKKCILYTCIYI